MKPDFAFMTIFDRLPQATITLDLNRQVGLVNAAAEKLFGWRREEIAGQPCPFFPAQGEPSLEDDGRTLQLTHRDQRLIPVKLRVASLPDQEDRMVGLVCTFEPLPSEAPAVGHSSPPIAHLEQLFQWGPGIFFSCRASGDFGATYVSDNVQQVLGYAPEEFTRDPGFWKEGLHPEDRPLVEDRLEKFLADGRIVHEYRFRHQDGSYRWVYDDSRVITNARGEVEEIVGYLVDISERRQMEDDLKASKERFNRLFESAPDGIYLHTLDGTIIDGNSAIEELIGYKREELIGKNFFVLDLIHPKYSEQVVALLARNAVGEAIGPVEIELLHRDGHLVPLEVRTLPIVIDGMVQILGIARDISSRKLAERQLRQARRRFQMIADHTPVILYTLDHQGNFTFAEGEGLKRLDLTRDDLIGQNIHSRFGQLSWHPKGSKSILALSEAVTRAQQGEVLTGTIHLPETDCYFETRLMPKRNRERTIYGLMGLAIDVTERWKAEQAHQQSQDRLRAVIDHAPVVLFALDREGRFTLSEGRGLQRSGLKNGQIIGQSVFEVYGSVPYHLDSGEILSGLEAFQRALAGEALTGVARVGEISYDTSLFPLFNASGVLTGVHGLSVDITERRQVEEELRRSQQEYHHIATQFRTVLDGIPDFLTLRSPELQIVWANSSASKGLGEAELQGLGCQHLWGVDAKACSDCPVVRAFASAQTESATLATADGRSWGVKAFPLVAADGTVTGVIEWVSDITERVRLQEESMHASRLASLGELAAGVAHEINNPNALVLLNAPILADTWPDIARILDQHLETQGDFRLGRLPYTRLREMIPSLHSGLLDGAQRIRRIVEELKDFVRQDDARVHQPLDLNEVVTAALRLVNNQIQNSTSRLEVFLAPDLPRVTGHFQQLEQIVINLVLNACQALPSPDRSIRLKTRADRERGRLLLTVQDQGRGIPPEHLGRLTDPFFTTRREKGGTGLGLSVSARIARDHKGKLVFQSKPGQGTCVTLDLPALNPES